MEGRELLEAWTQNHTETCRLGPLTGFMVVGLFIKAEIVGTLGVSASWEGFGLGDTEVGFSFCGNIGSTGVYAMLSDHVTD